MLNHSVDYWQKRFGDFSENHSNQNILISSDFLNIVEQYKESENILKNTNKIIEIGCGTGEFSYLINSKYKNEVIGTDLSENAIKFARTKYANDKLIYHVCDCLNESIKNKFGKFNLGICSNTLEHFKNPYSVIDNILEASEYLIILVPYNQPLSDGYDNEGGAGHVFTFTENSFLNYKTIEWFTFSSAGWQHSSKGETPMQLSILISKK